MKSNQTNKKLKMVIIGGGSSYTPEIIEGIIDNFNDLPVQDLYLVDIPTGEQKLNIVTSLAKKMVMKSGYPIEVKSTLDRREALSNADYVLSQIRVGGLQARAKDEMVPLKLGLIGQETTGAGGFAKALRTVPVILDIARDMEDLCPNAWLVNFSNPSGVVTEAVLNHTSIKSIGLCNVPINMTHAISEMLEKETDEIECCYAGLNHLSWVHKIMHNGTDLLPDLIQSEEGMGKIVANVPTIDGQEDILSAIKCLPSPYLNYYYFEDEMVKEELHDVESGKGCRAEQVMKIEEDLFKLFETPDLDSKPAELSERGGSRYSEAAISLIRSLELDDKRTHVLNVMNKGTFPSLPDNVVVETNCIVDRNGATPVNHGELPIAIRGLIQNVKVYEQLAIEAAVTGSKSTATLALLNHPLIHGASNASKLVEEILSEHKDYLTQFN